MTESEIQGIIDDNSVRNRELLRTLELKSVPVPEKRPIDHHFWANTQHEAGLLAQQLHSEGFFVSVIPPVNTTGRSVLWNVEATVQQSPLEATNSITVERLTRLAAQFNAVYDGWGTSI